MITPVIAGLVEGVVGGANNIIKSIWGSKAEKDEALAAEQELVLKTYMAEYTPVANRNWLDSIVDGVNRTVRPVCTYSSLGMVVWACIDPENASIAFAALATVPDWLWATTSGIMAFWFGSRMLDRSPSKVSIDPAKMALARDVAAARLALKNAREKEQKEEADAEALETKIIEEVSHIEETDNNTDKLITTPKPIDPSFVCKISDAGLNLIKRFEGFRSRPYKCPAGIWTIGYGHTKGVTQETIPISEAEGSALLREDVDWAERAVLRAVNTSAPLQQYEFDALVSFTYNLGEGNLRRSTLLKKLNAGDKEGAANEFLKWNKANGRVLKGLVKRREAEREMFLGRI